MFSRLLVALKAPTRLLVFISFACAAQAETRSLSFGAQRASADFPCTPKQQKRLHKTEVGELHLSSLLCSRGSVAFLLAVTEYPAKIVSRLSVEEILDSTLDDARSKRHMQIRSSARTTHQDLPAIRSLVLDTRAPVTETISLAVLAQRSIVVLSATAPPSAIQSPDATVFLASLKIAAE